MQALCGCGLVGMGAILFKAHLNKVACAELVEEVAEYGLVQAEDVSRMPPQDGALVIVRGVIDGAPHIDQHSCIYREKETLRLIESPVRRKKRVVDREVDGRPDRIEEETVECEEYVNKSQRVDFSYEQSNTLTLGRSPACIRVCIPAGTKLGDFIAPDNVNRRFEEAKGGSKRTIGFQVVERAITGGKHIVYVLGMYRSGPQASICPPTVSRREHLNFELSIDDPSSLAARHRFTSNILLFLSSACVAVGVALITHACIPAAQDDAPKSYRAYIHRSKA